MEESKAPHTPFEPRELEVICVLDLSEEERLKFCKRFAPDQIRDGKYRTPKLNAEMIKAKIKEREAAPDIIKQQQVEINELKEYIRKQNDVLQQIVDKLNSK